MAVYTDVSDEELDAFIGSYDIGALTSGGNFVMTPVV